MTTSVSITVSVEILQPIDIVWNCFINPEHIIHWNQALAEWHCPSATNDCKEGGRFCYTMSAKDGSVSFDFSGTYTKVIPNNLIEYTLDDNRKVIIQFTGQSDSVKITESFEPENVHTHEMQKAGWQAILESFKSYCESL